MFLTRFPINKTRRDARRLLASPYQMHAAIAGSFPVAHCSDSDKGESFGVSMLPRMVRHDSIS